MHHGAGAVPGAGWLAAALALLLAGCAAPLKMSSPDVYVPPQSLAVVPPVVRSFEIDADGKLVLRRDWEDESHAALEASLHYEVQSHGARYFDMGVLRVVNRPAFPEWVGEMLGQIAHEAHQRQKGHETRHQAVSEWRYSHPGLDFWRTYLGADYVLASVFLDGQNTTGRSVSNFLAGGFGGWIIDARREGLACVVSLVNGRVVWCALLPFNGLSVRERGGAQQMVDQLTAGLFAMRPPPGTRPSPPPSRPPAPPPAPPAQPATPDPDRS